MKRALFFLTILFFTNLVGIYFGMYLTWWFDMLHHFLGGFFVAMLMTHYLADVLFRFKNDPSTFFDKTQDKSLRVDGSQSQIVKNYLIILGAVSFIGVVWEFAEYLASQTLIDLIYNNFGFKAYFMGDLDDTINDLLMDILGATSWLLVYRKRQ